MATRHFGRIARAALALASACWAGPAFGDDAADREAFFEAKVRPILVERCYGCHSTKAESLKGSLAVDSLEGLLKGGDLGPAVEPGKPEESLLIQAVGYEDDAVKMPPKQKLPEAEIQALRQWVAGGATFPKSADAAPSPQVRGYDFDEARKHWSYQPVTRHDPPKVADASWSRSPIDPFILAKLEAAGLSPSPPADPRTLLRRVYFDLIGLPPTPEEVDAFEADPSPEAYARLVDRLLASPQYGERWGRRWLDLVRYADTAGETADYPVPEARHYRDYVIDAFNADLPYDRFLAEQIAGDLIAAEGPPERARAAVIATGFLAISRRFGFDPQNYHHLTIEDTIDALGKSVLGLTVACARCHDHKFDPVAAKDYYALYGVFASTRYPFPGGEETKRPKDFVTLAEGPDGPAMLAYAVAESPEPADARIQRRGDPTTLGPAAPRGIPEVFGKVAIPSGSGRRELAAWLASADNPLTARVIVNRIWRYHFGRGIVATASNFGVKGTPPSHPELLDWLASRFVAEGWSIKAMHRRLLMSSTYRQASEADAAKVEADPEDAKLSRFARRRLDAEEIRDALLAVSGGLDPSPAPAHPFPPVDQWGFTQHAPFLAAYPSDRRSVYLMTQRIRRHPFLGLFDGPDPNSSTEGRSVSTVPTQALYFLNDPIVHHAAEGLAARLEAVGDDPAARIDRAFRLALGRPATPGEVAAMREHVEDARAELAGEPDPPETLVRRAWASMARVLFGSNEFLYVD